MKDLILQYEKDFFNAEFCSSMANLDGRFSKDFFEYGKSGSVYYRECSINALMGLSKDKQIEITQFELTPLSENVLLVHYISYNREDNSYALRTSIWKTEDSNWKLYFHQGTPYRK